MRRGAEAAASAEEERKLALAHYAWGRDYATMFPTHPPMHTPLIASLLAAVLGFLSALHVYWAFGGRSGSVTVIPHIDGRPLFSPSRAATLLVAACLAAASLVALVQGAVLSISVDPAFPSVAALVIGTVFLLRAVGEFRYCGFFKRIRGTPFATWDTWLFSPLCVLIGAGFLVIARG